MKHSKSQNHVKFRFVHIYTYIDLDTLLAILQRNKWYNQLLPYVSNFCVFIMIIAFIIFCKIDKLRINILNSFCYVLLLQILLLTTPLSHSQNITCIGDYVCQNGIIDCDNGSDCFVDCIGEGACWNAIINCPSNGYECVVDCNWDFACLYAKIS